MLDIQLSTTSINDGFIFIPIEWQFKTNINMKYTPTETEIFLLTQQISVSRESAIQLFRFGISSYTLEKIYKVFAGDCKEYKLLIL
mgnify:FL=1